MYDRLKKYDDIKEPELDEEVKLRINEFKDELNNE